MSDAKNKDRRRWLRISMRAVHLGGISGIVGGSWLEAEAAQLQPWLLAMLLSGSVLLLTEIDTGRPYLPEMRAQLMIVKGLLLAAAVWLPGWRLVLLLAVIGLSAVVSHMPGRLRHLRIFDRT